MTTFNIDGPITEIVTAESFAINSFSGGVSGSPTTVTPTGASVSIVLLSCADSGGTDKYFELSSSFNVGDIIETYNNDANRHAIVLLDEHGNDVTSSALSTPNGVNELLGSIYRKLSTGAGNNWGRIS